MTTYKKFIEFDWRDGTYRFVEIPDYENGIPFDVYHGLCEWFGLEYREYDANEIVEAFKEEFGERLEEKRKKFDVMWDGHNHVAQWEEVGSPEDAFEEEAQLDYDVQL
jgi:hypothetical protein